jgi:hypothetical protein
MRELRILRAFLRTTKSLPIDLSDFSSALAAANLRGRMRARCGAAAALALYETAKMLVFLARWCNPNAVLASCEHDIATHSLLGGQHGEEAKEDGEGSEEGREKDEAPEEEVSARPSLRLRTTSVTASYGPAIG